MLVDTPLEFPVPPMLTALLLAAIPQGTTPTIDDRVEGAALIALARVVATPRVKSAPVVLSELSIERVLFGSELERAFGVPYHNQKAPKAEQLVLGQSYVLFLHERPIPSGDKPRRDLEELLQGAPLYTWFPGEAWKLTESGEHVAVPHGMLPAIDGPTGVEGQAAGDLVARTAFLDWLAARIEHGLPSIHVSMATTGPRNWSFSIGPDLVIRGDGASAEKLLPRRWRELWKRLKAERFDELPDGVGASQGPCASSRRIVLRTRQGSQVVTIEGDFLDRLGAPERDAAERALRIWKLLPVADHSR